MQTNPFLGVRSAQHRGLFLVQLLYAAETDKAVGVGDLLDHHGQLSPGSSCPFWVPLSRFPTILDVLAG